MGISKNILYKAKNKLGVFDWKDGFGSPVKWSLEGKPDGQPPWGTAIEAQ
jgi:hypothetical protein